MHALFPALPSAPGAYCPEKADTVLAATPAYSFGLKPKDLRPDDIPGNRLSSEEIVCNSYFVEVKTSIQIVDSSYSTLLRAAIFV